MPFLLLCSWQAVYQLVREIDLAIYTEWGNGMHYSLAYWLLCFVRLRNVRICRDIMLVTK